MFILNIFDKYFWYFYGNILLFYDTQKNTRLNILKILIVCLILFRPTKRILVSIFIGIPILPHTCTYRWEDRGVERKCKLREFRPLLCKSTFRPHPPKITRPSDYEIMACVDWIYRKPVDFSCVLPWIIVFREIILSYPSSRHLHFVIDYSNRREE